jgi:hypothetical protein
VPLIAAMAMDAVPNIRFTVAKTLQAALPVLRAKDLSTAEAVAILSKLATDPDRDVRFYTEKVWCENAETLSSNDLFSFQAQIAYKEV